MKFSTRIDKSLPAEQLFDSVADFDRIERMLIRRGVAVSRADDMQDGTRGWNLAFDWRGQRRALRLVLVQFDRPEKIALKGESSSFELRLDMSVVALARNRSRLIFELDVKPRNMRARLVLQTAKLGKAQIDRKLEAKVAGFVDDVTS
ncbi:MAG: hypothetical protein DI616_03310 [Paracoccus denitrificans]|uniref:SRPBCC family protein n=1 Tax=Paracoccus denitrificans TaxID=266 RepID=A0A533I9L8_PARDE|nr:MAG: hypothetical protein DI616_03310 [Paracoccus denitrificans]